MAPHTITPHTMTPHTMIPHTMTPHTMTPHTMIPHIMTPHTMTHDTSHNVTSHLTMTLCSEQRELLKKCASTSMCSKLIAYNKEFFSEMVVDAVMCLGVLMPLNMIGLLALTSKYVLVVELFTYLA